jgi:CUB domain
MTGQTGVFSDHNGPGDYLSDMKCSWIIQPSAVTHAIVLEFDRFDVEVKMPFELVCSSVFFFFFFFLISLMSSHLDA